MAFPTEPTGYEKTILSDLQGAWIVLRESVANCIRFEGVRTGAFSYRRGHELGSRLKFEAHAPTAADRPQPMPAGQGAR